MSLLADMFSKIGPSICNSRTKWILQPWRFAGQSDMETPESDQSDPAKDFDLEDDGALFPCSSQAQGRLTTYMYLIVYIYIYYACKALPLALKNANGCLVE